MRKASNLLRQLLSSYVDMDVASGMCSLLPREKLPACDDVAEGIARIEEFLRNIAEAAQDDRTNPTEGR